MLLYVNEPFDIAVISAVVSVTVRSPSDPWLMSYTRFMYKNSMDSVLYSIRFIFLKASTLHCAHYDIYLDVLSYFSIGFTKGKMKIPYIKCNSHVTISHLSSQLWVPSCGAWGCTFLKMAFHLKWYNFFSEFALRSSVNNNNNKTIFIIITFIFY